MTVPHAQCSAVSHAVHDCDYAATRMATRISTALSSAGVAHQTLVGDINRRAVDLNRRDSRYSTEFREHIRQLVTTMHTTHNVFTLDIHSYPKHHEWSGRTEYSMVFLYAGGPAPGWVSKLAASIKKTLMKNITIIDNIGLVNDIQDELHALGFKAVLMEFNESNTIITEEYLAVAVREWAKAV